MENNIYDSFPINTKLILSVNSTTNDETLTAGLLEYPTLNQSKRFVLIIIKQSLQLNIKTGNLKKCKCYIPVLEEESQSVNHAATLISKKFETHRKSNTKDVFRDVYFQDIDEKWKPLQKWREKIEQLFGNNIKNLTIKLTQKVNQPADFYKILDLMSVSRKIAQFLVDLKLNDNNESDHNDIDIKMQNIVNTLVGVGKLKQALEIWKDNYKNPSETFWQNLLTENSFILSQIFTIPVVILNSQPYVGGKRINNAGGNIPDFIVMNKLTRNVALIEIKTPATKILSSPYRNTTYNVSNELTGAVNQLLTSRDCLIKNYLSLVYNSQEHFEAFNPDCILILGNATEELLKPEQKSTFENYRLNSRNINIVTYDEMFEKIEILLNLLEGKK